jgi:hypothetical protein
VSDVTPPLPYSWVSLFGQFDKGPDEIIFRGYTYTPEIPKVEGQTGAGTGSKPPSPITPPAEPRGGVGKTVSNQRITDGTVSVDIEFESIDLLTTAEVMLQCDPVSDEMLNVGLGANGVLLNVRQWNQEKTVANTPQQTGFADENRPHWNFLRSSGDRRMLKPGQGYHLEMNVQGSFLTVQLDGVEIGSGPLPFQLSGKQVGLFCQSKADIHFRHLRVTSARPLAFVVMQFNPPEYEELFNDVITPVCDKMGLEAFRSSQTYYPGLVIADIQRQIRESRVIIAEITPVNPNVYYEVGYADAIGKPVILIADGGKLDQLPFDVRAFRTLFYENTIGGKSKVEKTLTEFLRNIMNLKN